MNDNADLLTISSKKVITLFNGLILFPNPNSISLSITTFGQNFVRIRLPKIILLKLTACHFFVKHPKSTLSCQVACTVIYSVTCFVSL